MQESNTSRPQKSPLLEQTQQLMRTRHMSIRTEEAYLRWIEQFLRFHKQDRGAWVHPAEMSDANASAFESLCRWRDYCMTSEVVKLFEGTTLFSS